ncbi:NADP-dependent oxidoreductase domain,Aldo/keto reductase, conserved site,Aldo/keto reductase [Cinara cedri]|uniref:NADP-dependent oxidoreductase domain,Aldo/keto reductase, conserved site,Aldo/keto reductase n=1 Tax=Cinara cedri TaxID=506608 RepID=A0A5E4MA46_9HEMI|nr:NADP-dependent oxidoreductase domain,Aldo/keto reductase, conserved site,Aldo/keto reductase [Cinara cedri]
MAQFFKKLNNNQLFPVLGICAVEDPSVEITSNYIKELEQFKIFETVKTAIDLGYRHFDCAPFYNNEKFVGMAITDKIREGAIKREDVWITGKVWNDKLNPEVEVEVALNCSLREIGLTYLDLYLIHCPTTEIENQNDYKMFIDNICDIWKAMEKCVHLGLTKSIGLSNFNEAQVKAILDIATIKPVVNEIQLHPYHSQNELREFCQSNSIVLTACEPLGLPENVDVALYLLEYYVVKTIARKYNKTNFQVIIKFQMQRGIIAIVKSIGSETLGENFDIWDFNLDLEDMDVLETFYSEFHNVRNISDGEDNDDEDGENEDILVDPSAIEQ